MNIDEATLALTVRTSGGNLHQELRSVPFLNPVILGPNIDGLYATEDIHITRAVSRHAV